MRKWPWPTKLQGVGALRAWMTRAVVAALAVSAAVLAGSALGKGDSSPGAVTTIAHTSTIHGGKSNDRIIGTPRHDVIDGRGGNDVIDGRGGRDRLSGGTGKDLIKARDRRQDTIDCGPGNDVAVVDRAENGVYDCEHVRFPKPGQKVTK
jgi:Ca2+-binding RTX toxin-like protein